MSDLNQHGLDVEEELLTIMCSEISAAEDAAFMKILTSILHEEKIERFNDAMRVVEESNKK